MQITFTRYILQVLLFCTCFGLYGQEERTEKTQFMLRGYGHTGFELKQRPNKETTFTSTTFSPIFLVRHSDKLLFESELEFHTDNNHLEAELEYADINYLLTDHITLCAGKFLLPFGIFSDRMHPSWINSQPTFPIGLGDDGLLPMSDIGAEIRGGAQIGTAKINYSFYCTNGPRLNNGTEEPDEQGMLMFENSSDNNTNKALGGRLGLLPLSNSSLELGFSVYSGKAGSKGDSLYQNLNALLYAADLSFVRQAGFVKGIIDIKAQIGQSQIDKAVYYHLMPGDTVPTAYSFNNQSSTYFVQLAYRPFMIKNKVVRNLEITGRFATVRTPSGSFWQQNSSQITTGINYWITWRNVIKISYETTQFSIPVQNSINGFFLQWAVGF